MEGEEGRADTAEFTVLMFWKIRNVEGVGADIMIR